ncbi:helix-turn-helix domain-containing protein [Nocardia cyriacigeorgica]|uniref:Helix-turn-helix domain-containing protein n=1 Tax=Nocardia cyriacigeorgica TaxID=135487 RepID=A0A6P1D831_9NOCA|nr:helix-turn-helix domain-containing protein [Nocardia cyriacigeorgica]NEW40009.1 helix-turn-helix domain-containing protein [Nocardia cyriacigeorgica]NEW46836.1 helix-turn-helix domain-containing protein [Nocardia cyriacigeorgica]
MIAIVELLAGRSEPFSIKDIAERLELSRSTTTLIMASLERAGWVIRQSDRRYVLGSGLIGVAEAIHHAYPALDDGRVLRQLAERAGCGVALALIGVTEATYVGIARGQQDLPTAVRVGTRLPLRAPLGAAVMAHRPAAQQRSWLNTAPAESRESLETVLVQAREFGVVVYELGRTDPLVLRLIDEMIGLLAEHPQRDSLGKRALDVIGELAGPPYEFSLLDEDESLPISYLSVPVFDRTNRALYELQLGPLRPHVSKPERDRLIKEIKQAAAELGN